MTNYLEHLHKFKPHVTTTFFKNWTEDRVSLCGVTMHLTEEFLAKIIGLPMEGNKFSKQTSISNTAFKKFPKVEVEEKNLEKNGDFYELDQIKTIWQDFLLCTHVYFILDGRNK